MIWFSNMMIPAVTLLAAAAGLLTGRPVFEDFIRGAKEGLKTAAGILPTLVGLMIGTGLLRASGLLGLLAAGVALVVPAALIPPAVIPVILVKLFSSSAATGLALDIFKELGPDSPGGNHDRYYLKQHGNGVLYHERLFYERGGQKDPLHAGRGSPRHAHRDCRQRLFRPRHGLKTPPYGQRPWPAMAAAHRADYRYFRTLFLCKNRTKYVVRFIDNFVRFSYNKSEEKRIIHHKGGA